MNGDHLSGGRVQLEAFVLHEVEQVIVTGSEVAGVLILKHTTADGFFVFVFPEEETVVSVERGDGRFALHEESAVN